MSLILNWDVASLYPSLMINEGYVSRSVSNPGDFKKVVDTRLEAKRRKDKATANALKLIVNSAYGSMLNKYNPMYDPLMARSVCISGQLYLTDLAVGLMQNCETFEMINFNTDGIMFSIEEYELSTAYEIRKEWENRTKLVLEEERISKIFMKDVNNYICKFEDGTIKAKGGFVSSHKGGNYKMNSLSIVHKALVEYFINGIPAETTINECKDIFAFQQIVKTGGTFEGSYHYVNGVKEQIQKVNRVYAVKDPKYGAVVKGKWITEKRKKNKETGKMESTPVDPPVWSETIISECPDHAFIDNENVLTVDDLDKDYYIDMAKKRIDKYINIDPTVARKIAKIKEEVVIMATKPEIQDPREMNVYGRLLEARKRFLGSGVKKSGKNTYAEFKYFTLEDIIPVKQSIFSEVGLMDSISFGTEVATLTLVNVDNPEETIEFMSPLKEDESLIKNPIQKLGAIQTYVRRYLYMLMLDIVEADVIEAVTDKPVDEKSKSTPPATKKSNRPATPEEREETKGELINKDGEATKTQRTAISNGLKKLRARYMDDNKVVFNEELEAKYDAYIKNIAKKVKVGISKTEAEDLLIDIGNKIEE